MYMAGASSSLLADLLLVPSHIRPKMKDRMIIKPQMETFRPTDFAPKLWVGKNKKLNSPGTKAGPKLGTAAHPKLGTKAGPKWEPKKDHNESEMGIQAGPQAGPERVKNGSRTKEQANPNC